MPEEIEQVKQLIGFTQKQLESMYRFSPGKKAIDFLVSKEHYRYILGMRDYHNRDTDKVNGCVMLFYKDDPEFQHVEKYGMYGIMFFLEDYTIEKLLQNNPLQYIGPENYHAYMTMVEETSHAFCLMTNITRERQLSLFEIELQASIDKFLLTVVNVARINRGAIPKGYLDIYINDSVELIGEVSPELWNRLKDANYYSSIFCKFLIRNYLLGRKSKKQMKQKINYFYHGTRSRKMELIGRSI
ncbi:MAG: hypothetical protein DRJ64_06395 [Thermoprotei archaeon]|nr:MAG: hypothetical protein DRJ64_06395 [Thermoprotei archaeon]